MKHQDYDLRAYKADDLDAVADLQRHLLGPDIAANRLYLEWKYHRNPESDGPYAVLAEYQGCPVGFRGYIPMCYRIGRGGQVVRLLALADTCVHPDHRRRGLFLAMTRFSLSLFSDAPFKAIINLSTSARPAPGYIKLGWRVMAYHESLSKMSLMTLVRRFTGRAAAPVRAEPRPLAFGHAADEPRPGDMASLAASESPGPARFLLERDEAFYDWRYRNPRERYRFFFDAADGNLGAFVVLREENSGREACIVDYAAARPEYLIRLIRAMVDQGSYQVYSVWNVAGANPWHRVFENCGFRPWSRWKRRLQAGGPPMPILVRPLVADPSTADWLLGDLEISKSEHWDLREICSDGA